MKQRNARTYLVPAMLVFIGLPLLLWATGDFPRRTLLKESLSVLTLVAFSLTLGQFPLARINGGAVMALGAARVVRYHKIIGYAAAAVLLVHPLLIVLPRRFEVGIDPLDALAVIITEFDSSGVLLGMAAWCLMLVLGVTSLIRGSLPMSPKTWRIFHGTLSGAFAILATWHALNLGRHTDAAFSAMLFALAAAGVGLFIWSHLPKPDMKEKTNE